MMENRSGRNNNNIEQDRKKMYIKLIVLAILLHSAQSQTEFTCPAGTVSVPTRPPRVAPGNYESIILPINNTIRDVFIYWQTVEEIEMCDYSFEYRAYYVTMTKDNRIIMHPSNGTSLNRAKFIGLRTNTSYNFRIYSANKNGLSSNYASLFLSRESDELEKPLSFTSNKQIVGRSNTYQLSWTSNRSKKFSAGDQLDYYTLYWCLGDSKYVHQCVDQLNWLHVPISETSYNLAVPNDSFGREYVFAISVDRVKNSFNSNNTVSSGILWEPCKTLHFDPYNTFIVTNVWATIVSSTYIGLRWKLDCTETFDLVDEFNIIYCPTISGNQCSGTQQQTTFDNKNMRHDRVAFNFITGLYHSTTYLIKIVMYSNSSHMNSIPISVKTLPKNTKIT
ncbi:uncharacterized protein LOC112682506 [Sipha flava]|uniref:Uncharacterized protein LOC112682506 n=1 Tax=Sipha flava TaxID=143950 RepID=A0A2S2PWT9_9HEMI|nr:uncharacterized protein LOC112682506 [Sipha flava]